VRIVGTQLKAFDACSVHLAPPPGAASVQETEQTRQDLSVTELELLGLMFAAAKDLFLLGLLDRCPPILDVCDRPRTSNAIHRTLMRNEAAYFGQIGLLLQHHDWHPERPLATFEDVMYVVGDSHVLSTAWKVINVQGKRTLLVPALVTGLKIWHLREEGVFYPKRHFEAITAAIPKGASVMFVLGEIDCREGVLPAVERGIYPSVGEAMKFLAHIYVKVLLRLRRKFSRVLMHQPPAVLDVTRSLILQLQGVLTDAFRRHQGPGPLQINVIDPPVLKCDGSGVLPEFELDSTHLSPSYVHQALEPSIAAALGPA
jgi:hypothetical protein